MSYEWQPITNQPTATSSQHVTHMSSMSTVHDHHSSIYPWQYPHGKRRDWSTGLFDCYDDMNTCLLGTFVPCHMCYISSLMGESLLVGACVPMANLVLRTLVRGRHNIEGSVMNDCLVTTLCPCCAQCQLAREVEVMKRGTEQRPMP